MEDFDNIEQQVRSLIAEQLQIDEKEVRKDSSIAELGADSFIALNLLSAFETHFDISISDDDAVNIDSFKSAVNIIKKSLNT